MEKMSGRCHQHQRIDVAYATLAATMAVPSYLVPATQALPIACSPPFLHSNGLPPLILNLCINV